MTERDQAQLKPFTEYWETAQADISVYFRNVSVAERTRDLLTGTAAFSEDPSIQEKTCKSLIRGVCFAGRLDNNQYLHQPAREEALLSDWLAMGNYEPSEVRIGVVAGLISRGLFMNAIRFGRGVTSREDTLEKKPFPEKYLPMFNFARQHLFDPINEKYILQSFDHVMQQDLKLKWDQEQGYIKGWSNV